MALVQTFVFVVVKIKLTIHLANRKITNITNVIINSRYAMPLIEINDLVKDYGDTRAVDHLNLQIEQGEIFGLLGPNGAGKTTIILTLLGLSEPTSGSVTVHDWNATSEPLKVKKITGYLPDDVGFSPNNTGLQSLVYTAMLNGIPKEKAVESAKELLEIVGLEDAEEKKTKTYSRGMKQRLGLADVLIKEPEIRTNHSRLKMRLRCSKSNLSQSIR